MSGSNKILFYYSRGANIIILIKLFLGSVFFLAWLEIYLYYHSLYYYRFNIYIFKFYTINYDT